ncbi:MAG: hypothetical protein A2W25_05180 [candidate division Zixibacteria bacterium RBG_16_53_22]|nr:MAG: hypothetical protein A2W25_05180 [candidate division Zixibacteria bacterium RBG_16_53_22]
MSVFTSLLNKEYHVGRRRRTPDGQGGWAIDYVEIDPIQGRMRPASSHEREVAMLEERVITHVFYCVEGSDIVRGDVISPGNLVFIDADVLSATGEVVVEVDAIREPSQADEHYEIDCRERQHEQATEEGS